MNKSKILVTGADGLVGSALQNIKNTYSNYDLIFANRKDADLTKEEQVDNLFLKNKPDFVIHAAARVGGIGINLNSPAQQFRDNILMNTNVIHSCFTNKVKKMIAFSSVCAFPNELEILHEDKMHNGIPNDAHRSYAYSKRMIDIQIEAYNKQYGVNYCSVIPGNIFGEKDNYSLQNGHVIPSLIHKFFLAKKNNKPVVLWGNGQAYREFISSSDIAKLCLELLTYKDLPNRIIMSGEKEFQIKQIAMIISDIMNYKNIIWDTSMPSGQMRRPSNRDMFRKYFPNFKFEDINTSLQNSIKWFEENYPNVRM